jgi:hypothetical protein
MSEGSGNYSVCPKARQPRQFHPEAPWPTWDSANIVRLIVIFSNVYGTRLGAMTKGINNILHNEPAGATF